MKKLTKVIFVIIFIAKIGFVHAQKDEQKWISLFQNYASIDFCKIDTINFERGIYVKEAYVVFQQNKLAFGAYICSKFFSTYSDFLVDYVEIDPSESELFDPTFLLNLDEYPELKLYLENWLKNMDTQKNLEY